jgi:hypothetical protein
MMLSAPHNIAAARGAGSCDHEIKRRRYAELRFDLQARAGRRDIAHDTTDGGRAIECDRPPLEDSVTRTLSSLMHGSAALSLGHILLESSFKVLTQMGTTDLSAINRRGRPFGFYL